MLASGSFEDECGEDEQRVSKLVFIGKNLDAKVRADGVTVVTAVTAVMVVTAVTVVAEVLVHE